MGSKSTSIGISKAIMHPRIHLAKVVLPRSRLLLGALLGVCLQAVAVGQTLYWDTNGTTAGAGGSTPSGGWATNNGVGNRNWSTNAIGTTATSGWTNGYDAVFSAGSDATGSYTVTASGTVGVSSITIEEGSPTFASGIINFSDATPDFTVATGSTATVGSDISGTNGLTKLGGGSLIFGTSDKTYTGTTTVSAGTLDLAFNQGFDSMALAGGTLKLSSVSNTITSLTVTANSIIDFGGADATLSLSTLSITGGATLTIINWTAAADFFYVNGTWNGFSVGNPSVPTTSVVFTGASDPTVWQSFDNQVRPNVPEPATYGFWMVGLITGWASWRRRRVNRAQS